MRSHLVDNIWWGMREGGPKKSWTASAVRWFSFRVFRSCGKPLQYLLRHAPHVITLHFRGLRPIGVSPYWLGDPRSAFTTQRVTSKSGIPADQPVTPPKRGNSSLAVAPTTGFNPTWPADVSATTTPKSDNNGSVSNSHGVLLPFDALARASLLHAGLPHRLRSVLRVLHPLDGLLLTRTSDPISCR